MEELLQKYGALLTSLSCTVCVSVMKSTGYRIRHESVVSNRTRIEAPGAPWVGQ